MLQHIGRPDDLHTQPTSKIHQFPLTPTPYSPTTYKLLSTISAPKGTFIHKS